MGVEKGFGVWQDKWINHNLSLFDCVNTIPQGMMNQTVAYLVDREERQHQLRDP